MEKRIRTPSEYPEWYKEKMQKEDEEKQSKNYISPKIVFAIRLSMAIIAPFALFLSGYFSIHWLEDQQPIFIAVIFGLVLVTFATLSFEAMVLFFRRKQLIWVVFFLLWLLLTTISMMSIVASLYNNYLDRIYEKETSQLQNNLVLNQYNNEIGKRNIKIGEIDSAIIKKDVWEGVLKELDTIEKQEANKTKFEKAYAEYPKVIKEIGKLNADLEIIKQNILTMETNNPELVRVNTISKRKNIFGYLSDIVGTDEEFVMFLFQVIPALVLDLIASMSLYIFLYTKNLAHAVIESKKAIIKKKKIYFWNKKGFLWNKK